MQLYQIVAFRVKSFLVDNIGNLGGLFSFVVNFVSCDVKPTAMSWRFVLFDLHFRAS